MRICVFLSRTVQLVRSTRDVCQVLTPIYHFCIETLLPKLQPYFLVSKLGYLNKQNFYGGVQIIYISGTVVGVDEESAYMWPACGVCENELLSLGDGTENYRCEKCNNECDNFIKHMSLQVLCTCPDLPLTSSVRIKVICITSPVFAHHQFILFSVICILDLFMNSYIKAQLNLFYHPLCVMRR